MYAQDMWCVWVGEARAADALSFVRSAISHTIHTNFFFSLAGYRKLCTLCLTQASSQQRRNITYVLAFSLILHIIYVQYIYYMIIYIYNGPQYESKYRIIVIYTHLI